MDGEAGGAAVPRAEAAGPEAPARSGEPSAGELDVGWGEPPPQRDGLSEDDERLLRERPPHWE